MQKGFFWSTSQYVRMLRLPYLSRIYNSGGQSSKIRLPIKIIQPAMQDCDHSSPTCKTVQFLDHALFSLFLFLLFVYICGCHTSSARISSLIFYVESVQMEFDGKLVGDFIAVMRALVIY